MDYDNCFKPFKIDPIFGKGDLYGISDSHFNGNAAILRNFQRGKKGKGLWKGTLQQATDLCDLLNRNGPTTAVETSATQKRYYANRAAKRKIVNPFKQCHCGAMYKGDKHCE